MKKLILIALAMLVAVGAFAQMTADKDVTLTILPYAQVTAPPAAIELEYDPAWGFSDWALGGNAYSWSIDTNFDIDATMTYTDNGVTGVTITNAGFFLNPGVQQVLSLTAGQHQYGTFVDLDIVDWTPAAEDLAIGTLTVTLSAQ